MTVSIRIENHHQIVTLASWCQGTWTTYHKSGKTPFTLRRWPWRPHYSLKISMNVVRTWSTRTKTTVFKLFLCLSYVVIRFLLHPSRFHKVSAMLLTTFTPSPVRSYYVLATPIKIAPRAYYVYTTISLHIFRSNKYYATRSAYSLTEVSS